MYIFKTHRYTILVLDVQDLVPIVIIFFIPLLIIFRQSMGDIGHERFLFFGSISPGAFIENRWDSAQVSHTNYTRCNGAYEVRLNI